MFTVVSVGGGDCSLFQDLCFVSSPGFVGSMLMTLQGVCTLYITHLQFTVSKLKVRWCWQHVWEWESL